MKTCFLNGTSFQINFGVSGFGVGGLGSEANKAVEETSRLPSKT